MHKIVMLMMVVLSPAVFASEVAVPNVFTGGEAAIAGDVNANFDALEDGVNDNHARISTLENNSANGKLDKPLTGVVAMANNTNIVNGVGTLFTVELNVGDAISIEGETFTVSEITDDVVLTTELVRSNAGVVDVNIFSDGDLLRLNSGSGAEKAVVTKSGDLIRRAVRATGLGPNDGRDTGLINGRTLVFKKSRDDTAVRIGYSDSFRVIGVSQACRWEVMIDGASCPGLIPDVTDPLVFDFHSSTTNNLLRSGSVFGYCEGLGAGVHTITVNVGPVLPSYAGSDCYTGWRQSRWTIEAEEVY